jgi:hypothetical protein
MVLGTVRDGMLDLLRGSQGHSNLNYLKRGHQAQVHSDQMVSVMARRKAEPHERRLKKLKGELDNIPGSLGTYSENWHSDSLKRFNLLFFRVRRRREMQLLMMKMMMQ